MRKNVSKNDTHPRLHKNKLQKLLEKNTFISLGQGRPAYQRRDTVSKKSKGAAGGLRVQQGQLRTRHARPRPPFPSPTAWSLEGRTHQPSHTKGAPDRSAPWHRLHHCRRRQSRLSRARVSAPMPEPMTPSDCAREAVPGLGLEWVLKKTLQWRLRRAGFGSPMRMRQWRPGPTASHLHRNSQLAPWLLFTRTR